MASSRIPPELSLGSNFPTLKRILIDERDQYLAHKIFHSDGKKVVAVVGAGHIPGIKLNLGKEYDIAPLDIIPPPKKLTKIIAWTIPVLIIAVILFTLSSSPMKAMDQVWSWVFWNSTLAGLGALIAWGHPLTILTAILVSPISSLNPLLSAGWFAGLTEAIIRKPKVKNFETLTSDVESIKGFWKNQITRVLLVVIFSNIGSSLGAWIGGFEIMKTFFQNL